MTDGEPNRRRSDSEAFVLQIVAEQATIRTKVELLHDMVTMQLQEHKTKIDRLEAAIVGGPSGPGLLEKNRNIAKDVAKLFGYFAIAAMILWKVVSPMYDAWVNRWIPEKIGTVETQSEPPSTKIVRKAK